MLRIEFKENGYCFRELRTASEFEQSTTLRYQVVCEERNWVPGDPARSVERDQWDSPSFHFGAFDDEGVLAACLRLTPENPNGFMTFVSFGSIASFAPVFSDSEAGDISRLIFREGYRHHLRQLGSGLYRLAYGRARLERINGWYFVTDRGELAELRLGFHFPIVELGRGRTSDGNMTYVCSLDLNQAQRALKQSDPDLLEYFETAQQDLVEVVGR
jgi:N-acyl-L-homoserine lactone synthetase